MKRPRPGLVFWIAVAGSLWLVRGPLYAGPVLMEEAADYRREGRRLQEAGQIDQALEAYAKAVLIFPEYADAHVDLGVLYEAKGQPASAEAAYRRALAVDPVHPAAHTNLALLYEAQGKIDQAAPHWQGRVQLGPGDDPWVRQARERLLKYRLKVPEAPAAHEAKQRGKAALAMAPSPKPSPTVNYMKAKPLPKAGPPRIVAEKKASAEALTKRARDQQLKAAKAMEQSLVAQKRATPRPVAMPKPKAVEPKKVEPKKVEPPAKAPVTPPPVVLPKAMLAGGGVTPISTPQDAKALSEQLAREKERTRDLMVRELHQRGLILFQQKQYAQAMEQFQRALAINPDHRESQHYLRESQAALARGEK